ncbi:hypothetical protein JW948_10050 [bacterium]|nr:hypothetical protein [bacterium]
MSIWGPNALPLVRTTDGSVLAAFCFGEPEMRGNGEVKDRPRTADGGPLDMDGRPGRPT